MTSIRPYFIFLVDLLENQFHKWLHDLAGFDGVDELLGPTVQIGGSIERNTQDMFVKEGSVNRGVCRQPAMVERATRKGGHRGSNWWGVRKGGSLTIGVVGWQSYVAKVDSLYPETI